MTAMRKLLHAALILAAAGYYSSATVSADLRCEDMQGGCPGDFWYHPPDCWTNSAGKTCGNYSCGSDGPTQVCCWDRAVSCGS
jgi:hypothetical protein